MSRMFSTAAACLWLLWLLVSTSGAGAEEGEPAEALAGVVRRLDDDAFPVRQAAQEELGRLVDEHEQALKPALLEKLVATGSPEVRFRLYGALLKLAKGATEKRKQGFIGIQMTDAEFAAPDGKALQSILVRMVVPGSAAAEARLRIGTNIVGIDGKRFDPPEGEDTVSARFASYVRKKAAGEPVKLEVFSPGQQKPEVLLLKLGERPAEYAAMDLQDDSFLTDTVETWIAEAKAKAKASASKAADGNGVERPKP